MRYYPVNLDISNKSCLVVGGGPIGARKAKTLATCGAKVTVVSIRFDDRVLKLADGNSVSLKQEPYQSHHLDGMFLVIGATSDQALNRQISLDAQERNMLCNIADVPEACNFILPSIVHQGDLLIAVSTSGKSPAFAKKVRKDLEKEFGEEYAAFLKMMGAIRKKLLSERHEPEAHKHIFEQLIGEGLLQMIKDKKKDDINFFLQKVLGDGYAYDELMNSDE